MISIQVYNTNFILNIIIKDLKKYNCFVAYEYMLKDLLGKDKTLYTQNGILHMLERNKRIKPKPERFQELNEQFIYYR